jgi:molecular chaperone GrpE (heat shock protein)
LHDKKSKRKIEVIQMFFSKKRDEADRAILSEIHELSDKIDSLNNAVEGSQKSIRNNSDTISDFIDEIQDKNDSERALGLQVSELKADQQRLLDIISDYSQQLDMFYNGVTQLENKDDLENHISWEKQLFMAKNQIENSLMLCGIQKTGQVEEKTDYRIHEIIDIVETDNKEQNELIARVYSKGIIYKGKVIRKAKVAVYKYIGI